MRLHGQHMCIFSWSTREYCTHTHGPNDMRDHNSVLEYNGCCTQEQGSELV